MLFGYFTQIVCRFFSVSGIKKAPVNRSLSELYTIEINNRSFASGSG